MSMKKSLTALAVAGILVASATASATPNEVDPSFKYCPSTGGIGLFGRIYISVLHTFGVNIGDFVQENCI